LPCKNGFCNISVGDDLRFNLALTTHPQTGETNGEAKTNRASMKRGVQRIHPSSITVDKANISDPDYRRRFALSDMTKYRQISTAFTLFLPRGMLLRPKAGASSVDARDALVRSLEKGAGGKIDRLRAINIIVSDVSSASSTRSTRD